MPNNVPYIRKLVVQPARGVRSKTTLRRVSPSAFFYIRKCVVQPTKGRVPEVTLHRIGVVTARKSGEGKVCFTASLCSPLDKFDAAIALEKASKHSFIVPCNRAFDVSFVELMEVLGMTHPQAIAQLSTVLTRLHNRALRRIVCDALDIRMDAVGAYPKLVKTTSSSKAVSKELDKKLSAPVKRKSNKKSTKV